MNSSVGVGSEIVKSFYKIFFKVLKFLISLVLVKPNFI